LQNKAILSLELSYWAGFQDVKKRGLLTRNRSTMESMRAVFCAAEASPFAKVGGLGDVVGSLPKALAACGVEVMVCLPAYGCITDEEHILAETGIEFTVTYLERTFPIRVLESKLPGSNVPVYFFANDELYGKPIEVYPQGEPAFTVQRFEVLGLSIFQLLKTLNWKPDVFHLHDWHTANMAVLLKEDFRQDPLFQHAGTVLTIHNMAYQGVLKGYNTLKEGILYSDALVAVSPNYAQEITSAVGGAGLQGVVASQKKKLHGILNGIDMDLFNPATDPFLAWQYGPETVESGKAVCKEALQHQVHFKPNTEVPVFGMVVRLVEQKGIDLLLEILPELAKLPAQFVILGSGQKAYEERLTPVNATTDNIRCMVGYNLALGQQIYAGSDIFLMPSHFEPCGLGQLIALRYGTTPVVRKTGGLADTVFDIDADPVRGNGFVFEEYTSEAFLAAIKRALAHWQARSPEWWNRMKKVMVQDMSWDKSAREYLAVYETVHQQAVQRI
jgi:starch synthase